MRNESILFASDLDNTLLFSHQHARAGDVCVEHLDGKAQGFFPPGVIRGLAQINRTMRFVPVTSRSIAQFLRIQFPAGCVPKYALVANGGLLLRIGEATRVLLRRMPWKILVHSLDDEAHLGHLYQLAREKQVPLEVYPLVHYRACGLIREMADA